MASVTQAWSRLVSALEQAGWPVHEALRPPADEAAVEDAQALAGVPLHEQVRELYSVTAGVDEDWWSARYVVPAYLVPTLGFPSVRRAGELCRDLAAVAQELEGGGGLGDMQWFAPFHLWTDEFVAVDSDTGHVWLVWWEDDRIEQIADSLSGYLEQCRQFVTDSRCTFNPQTGAWVFPEDTTGATSPIPDRRFDVDTQPVGEVLSVAEAFGDLMAAHEEIGSPVPQRLRRPVTDDQIEAAESALGFQLHADVKALLLIADGIDSSLWPHDRAAPEIVPRLRFPSLADLMAANHDRRTWTAGWTEGRDRLWGREWFAVFVYGRTMALVVDCATIAGTVYRASWEITDRVGPGNPARIAPIAPDLATYLAGAARRMRATSLEVDQLRGRIDWTEPWGEQFL